MDKILIIEEVSHRSLSKLIIFTYFAVFDVYRIFVYNFYTELIYMVNSIFSLLFKNVK